MNSVSRVADSSPWPRHSSPVPSDLDGMVERAALVLGKRYRFIRPLAGRVLAAFGGRASGFAPCESPSLWANDKGFQRAFERNNLSIHFARWATPRDDAGRRPAGIVESPGHRHARRAGELPRDRARRARLVRRYPGPRAHLPGRGLATLPVPVGGQAVGLVPADRSTQAAIESDSATAAR